jgi:hypothetical protein
MEKMKTVKITGFESHIFKEGRGYNLVFENKNRGFVKKRKFIFKNEAESNKVSLRFNFKNETPKLINDQSYDDIFDESKTHNLSPFVEKENAYKELKSNRSVFVKNYGEYSKNILVHELESLPYEDIEFFNVKSYVKKSAEELQTIQYPFEFNISEYYKKGSRIDVFDAFNKLKISSIGVDLLKGMRGYALKSSVDANKRSNNITDKYLRNFQTHVFFEDGILENYIYNKNGKKIIKSISVDISGETQVVYKDTTVISREPRYINHRETMIKPFHDSEYNLVSNKITNDNQFFINKLSNDTLNNILLKNRNKYDYLEEDYLYTSRGRSIDLTNSQGIDSLVFYESLD